jgi:hypothetical protein
MVPTTESKSNPQVEVEGWTVDLADLTADQVLELWSRVEQAEATREVDPELRASILKRCDQLGDRDLAAAIREELDVAHPAVVLEQHWRELIADRPTLGAFRGAFPRRDRVVVPTADEWLREDPRRLGNIVAEVARFTVDLKAITVSVLELADRLGIDEQEADRIVCAALRNLPKRASHAS